MVSNSVVKVCEVETKRFVGADITLQNRAGLAFLLECDAMGSKSKDRMA